MSAVTVRLGAAEFGLPMERVRAVLRPPPLTRVPFPPPDVAGLVHLRGALVAVLDLGTRLRSGPARRPGRLVVVARGDGGEPLALLVDAVAGTVETGDLVDPPPAEAVAALPDGWLEGVVRSAEGRPVALLHLDNVLAGVDA
ncbi:MAG TPA: chemotaxis protein CheW [Longimicrobiaceae bacterium]|nr:chemotaxis protein CheW [Longimicrobiaceae bacterium]